VSRALALVKPPIAAPTLDYVTVPVGACRAVDAAHAALRPIMATVSRNYTTEVRLAAMDAELAVVEAEIKRARRALKC